MKKPSKGQEEAYQKVQTYMKEHDCGVSEATKKLRVSSSQYYAGKIWHEGKARSDLKAKPVMAKPAKRKYTRRVQSVSIPVAEMPMSGKVMLIVGDAKTITDIIGSWT